MLKHYVHFDTPGSLFPETKYREVSDRVPAHLTSLPRGAYAIQYVDIEEAILNEEVLVGRPKNPSRRIVFGEIFDRAALLKMGYTEEDILYRNTSNSNGSVIRCVTGNWQPAYPEYIVLKSYDDLKNLTEPI